MSTELANGTAAPAIAKLPISGYQMYKNKREAELKLTSATLDFVAVSKTISGEWNAMSKDVEQKVWRDQCAAARAAAKAAGIPIQRRKSSKPLKVPVLKTGFAMYQTMHAAEFKDLSFLTRSKTIGPIWTAKTDVEKKPYFDAAAVQYKKEMEDYTIALAAEAVYAAAEAAEKAEKRKRAAEERAAKKPKVEGEPKKEKKVKAEAKPKKAKSLDDAAKPKKAKKSKKAVAESSDEDDAVVAE
jgi:hypothetical protein